MNRILGSVVSGLVRFYRLCISPVLPSRCIHTPSCSAYMEEAVRLYGARGVWLGIKRLLRCHPFSKGGYDPVPLKEDME